MSTSNFVKGECRACGGHLEFPAVAAGESIVCPHCSERTALVPGISPNKNKDARRILAGLLALIVVAGSASGYFLMRQAKPVAAIPAAVVIPTNNSPALATAKEASTNDFALSAIQLEKTPGSSLVYATGKIRNLSDHRRFGVKVELNLFDAGDQLIGQAKDYQSLLEPGAEWQFKAMIMESKAVSARVNSIREDQ